MIYIGSINESIVCSDKWEQVAMMILHTRVYRRKLADVPIAIWLGFYDLKYSVSILNFNNIDIKEYSA